MAGDLNDWKPDVEAFIGGEVLNTFNFLLFQREN